ncbi:MAG: FlgD immunoglobulin-like domain containing protein [Candidatus Latescibacterota bacterium]
MPLPCDFDGNGIVDAIEQGQCGTGGIPGGGPGGTGNCDANSDGTVDPFEAQQCGGGTGGAPDGGGVNPAVPPYEEWVVAAPADLNGDGKVDRQDYDIMVGGSAPPGGGPGGTGNCDANNDGTVDPFEAQQCGGGSGQGIPPLDQWLANAGEDLNGDNAIDEADYTIFVQGFYPGGGGTGGSCDTNNDGTVDPFEATQCGGGGTSPNIPTLDQWLANAGQDLSGDGEVDEEDYRLFVHQTMPDPGTNVPPVEQWLANNGQDLNGDGKVDEEDYRIFVASANGQPTVPTLDHWLAEAGQDLNGDGVVDEADYAIFVQGFHPGGPGGTGNCDTNSDGTVDPFEAAQCGGGEIVPQVPTLDHWLANAGQDLNGDGRIDRGDYEIFVSNLTPGPVIPTLEQWLAEGGQDLNDDGEIDERDYGLFVQASMGGPGGDPCDTDHNGVVDDFERQQCGGVIGPDPLLTALQGLRDRLQANPRLRLRITDLQKDGELDGGQFEFLRQLAGLDGVLTLDEIQAGLAAVSGAGTGGAMIERFEGVLEGIDLAGGLLYISGQEYRPAPRLAIQDNQGQGLELKRLVELAGSLPKVVVELNEGGEVARLQILSRVEAGTANQAGTVEGFFGEVIVVDQERIVLRGPRFVVTSRTGAVSQSGAAIQLSGLVPGALVSVTPGPPDLASGFQDPTAIRIQVIDPLRPPAGRADLVTAPLQSIGAAGSDAPFVLLDGPRALVNEETRFVDLDGNSMAPEGIAPGDFVSVMARPPQFGESGSVAVEVHLMGSGAMPPVSDEETQVAVEEIRVEGFVASVGGDYLVLEGQRAQVDAKVVVNDLSGRRIAVAGLVPGDLLEMDTRAGGARGFIVSRIKVIDPSAQTFQRPGVLIGTFDHLDGTDLVLAGPYFQVPEDAKVSGMGGRSIGLADLRSGNYVRLTASSPRFDRGETLPVAFEIRVVQAPVQAPTGSAANEPAQRVNESYPADGDVAVPVQTVVEVRFNGNANSLLYDPEFQFTLFPEPESFGGVQISRDGRQLSAEVVLAENQAYQLVVVSGQTGFYSAYFTTGGDIAQASISGAIVGPSALPHSAKVLSEESFAVLVRELPEGAALDDINVLFASAVAGVPLSGREYSFERLEPGTYYVAALVTFDLNRGERLVLQALLDSDQDGRADPVEIGETDQMTGLDIQLRLAEPLRIVTVAPAMDEAGVDLETSIVVEFNRPATLASENLQIFPPPERVGDLQRSEDGKTYTLPVTLADESFYQLLIEGAVDEQGGGIPEPFFSFFATADGFGELLSVSGRLVLPDLPAARVFEGPVLVGLVDATGRDLTQFGFESFTERDIVASTVTVTPEFTIENVPPGDYVLAAFTRVKVPRGFRAPDPRVRSLRDFAIETDRFGDQALQVFDTIELFGAFTGPGPGAPQVVQAGAEGLQVFLYGRSKTRQQILLATAADVDGVPLLVAAGAPVPEVGSADVEIRVRFNKALRFERGIAAIEANLNGQLLQAAKVEDDGRTVVLNARLEDGVFYRLSVYRAEAQDGSKLERPLDLSFSTGAAEVAFGSVAGTVTLTTLDEEGQELTGDDADHVDGASVFLFEEADGSAEPVMAGVAGVGEDGSFLLEGLVPGRYTLFAELSTASGQTVSAVLDADADGAADLLAVESGNAISGLDIAATVIIAATEDNGAVTKTTPPGGNAEAGATFDLDATAGNQSVLTLSNVEVGREVTLDLFVSGVTDLSGFVAKVRYDADVLAFVSATDAVSGYTSLLRAEGGMAMYLSPLLREPELEYGAAILGANNNTAPDGDGWLARFTFKVTTEFEGARIFLEELTLKSVKGEDVLTPSVAAKLAPPVFEEQEKGPVSFDFNTAAGDQEEFHQGLIAVGSQVDVDVYLNLDKIGGGLTDLSNYLVTVEYDPSQVTFISYSPDTPDEANLLASGGGTVPPMPAITTDRSVTFGGAILGPTAANAPDQSGLVGRLTFATTDAFAETDLLMTEYSVKKVGGAQQKVETLIIARMSTGEIARVAAGGTGTGTGGATANAQGSDFDGDGQVGFGDFFLFADAFGQVGTGANAAFDLDGDGQIGFGDFFAFADQFGRAVSKGVPSAPVLGSAALELTALSEKAGVRVQLRAAAVPIRGYAAVVEYDPSAFRLAGVEDETSALRVNGGEALLVTEEGVGQVFLLGGSTGGAQAVSGLLAELRFEPVSPEAVGTFRVGDAAVRQADGSMVRPQFLGQVETRWVPTTFALHANYPNPFNPATTIAYQLPQAAPVRLEVFDVLGQRVRILVSGMQPAGYHRVTWDSRDGAGQAVGAGVYLYRLQAGDFVEVRKLLLLK